MSTSWNSRVAETFGHKASLYDQFAAVQGQIAALFAADLPVNASSILEIGCGTGSLSAHLAERYPKSALHITDISAAMMQQAFQCPALKAHKQLRTALLDAEHERLKAPPFNLITGNMVCQWFSDIEAGINNLSQMLGEGGEIYLTMPGLQSFGEWRQTLQQLDLPCGMLDFTPPRSVYRREIISQPIENAQHFLHILKNTGASRSPQDYKPLSPAALKAACAAFDAQGFKAITWEILFIRRGKEA